MRLRDIRHASWFETVYKVGIGIKGFDGFVELVVGLLLIFAPHTPHKVLLSVAREAHEHNTAVFRLIDHSLTHLDMQLTGNILLFIIIFLVLHGVVKLVLVYSLLRKIHWVYPYALVILAILFVIQVIPLFSNPGSIDLWLFTILDAAIIYLVFGEYQDLKEAIAKQKH